jgi:hypothetical protein
VEEVGEAWTRWWRRSGRRRRVVPIAVPRHGGEVPVDGVVPEHFNVEEE